MNNNTQLGHEVNTVITLLERTVDQMGLSPAEKMNVNETLRTYKHFYVLASQKRQ
ncbi:MAG: hypothetical protein IT291_02255 [Deltaproteobacteria bacterium]|nr:hypothetical protein [Deltaproteobacteria bacterium]